MVVISTRGVPGVLEPIRSTVADAIGINVGVDVNVAVGGGVKVAVGGGVDVLSTTVGVMSIASDVGVEYTPQSEGVCPQDVSSRAVMQDTTT